MDEFSEFLEDFEPEIIGRLLSGFTLKVLPNQREYSWDIEHWSELWDDILDVIKNKNTSANKFEKFHFLGPMFLVRENKKGFLILDGQQRIATISMLLSLIHDLLFISQKEIKPNHSAIVAMGNIYNCLFEKVDDKSEVRLTLNKKNEEFYKKLVKVSEKPIEPHLRVDIFKKLPLNDSEKKILGCYIFFLNQIFAYLKKKSETSTSKRRLPERSSLLELVSEERTIRFLLDLNEVITDRLYFLKIVVPNYEMEYEIFETLNQRGVKLEIKDLFKNMIFGRLGDKQGQEIWNTIERVIGGVLDDFLMHYWRSKFCFVRTKKLFKAIKNEIREKTIGDLKEFLENMIEEGKIYCALQNPTDSLWNGKVDISEILYDIGYLNLRQGLPLLLSTYVKFANDNGVFKRILKAYLNLCVRAYTVLGKNPNELEEKYSEWAIQIRNKEGSVNSIIDSIEQEIPADEEFAAGFINLEISPKNARYILCKINDSLVSTQLHKVWMHHEPTVEHVIPQNPNSWWVTYLQTKHMRLEDFVDRLGNLTILSKAENSELGNISYTDKRQKYLKMDLEINNKSFAAFTEFDEIAIKEREKILAKIAVDNRIWT